jgi:ADP-ribose pyrophosphatase
MNIKIKTNWAKEEYHNDTFSLVTENITLPNGNLTDMSFIRHPGSAGIVPMLDDDSVVLTLQYRHPVGRWMLEIPAGTMIPGESPIACAMRELEEEAGFFAEEYTDLSQIHILPSYSDEKIHIFLARGLKLSRPKPDEDEIIQVVTYPRNEVMRMINTGEITCALTIIAMQQACSYLDRENTAA